MNGRPERIAITGVGLVTALGSDAPTTFGRLVAGDRGFGPVTLLDVREQRCRIAAEVRGLRVADVAPPSAAADWSRSDAMALVAAQEALASAGLVPGRQPCVLAVGATAAGMYEADQVLLRAGPDRLGAYGREIVARPLATVAERLAGQFGNVRRKTTLCGACSSGALAIVQGAVWIELGVSSLALVGGVDALSLLTFTGFGVLGAVGVEPCQPFDVARAGMTLGEGAGFLVLESEGSARARDARVIAWLTGWAVGAEAHHITHPEPSGATASRLLTQAMERAGLAPDGVDYVNAHGTGTPPNDAMEALALRAALGDHADRVWVSSSKGQLGHTLGAAGAVEAIVSALALERAVVPPTGGLATPDPATPLRHVVGHSVPAELRAALSSSFGFGGTGVVLALEHAQAEARSPSRVRPREVVLTGFATWGERGLSVGEQSLAWLEEPEGPPVPPPELLPSAAPQMLDPSRSRRFDLHAALTTAGAERALVDARREPEGTGMVMGLSHGPVERSVQFLGRAVERGPRMASPAEFPHLVPSAAAGNASVYLGLKGPVLAALDPVIPGESAFHTAACWVQAGVADACLAGATAVDDPVVANAKASLGLGPTEDWNGHAAGWILLESARSAAERGRIPYARLVAAAVCSELSEVRTAVLEPKEPERSRLVFLGPSLPEATFRAALGGSAWLEAPRIRVLPPRGGHDAWGSVAIAAAASLLQRGLAEEVLVWTVGQEAVSVVQLRTTQVAWPTVPA